MNTFMNGLAKATNVKVTENGAVAHKSTLSAVYDMFALGGAYRSRTPEETIHLFEKALNENTSLAMKCLFYLRDIRGGQGEREFFRICFKWLANNYPEVAQRNLIQVPEFGRWDDLVYTTLGTPIEEDAIDIIATQLSEDIDSYNAGYGVSLLAKWLPSENATSAKTKAAARRVRNAFGLTSKEYRKTLSTLRGHLKVLEKLMSEGRWDEIEFDKIPSKAGLIYKNAFARRDLIAEKYAEFAKSDKTTVNARALYPYEVVSRALNQASCWGFDRGNAGMSETDRAIINKYWENLPDYFDGKPAKMLAVVDTSGSMTCSNKGMRPIDVAISLGLYCAERNTGDFAGKYISFASRPQLIDTTGKDLVEKARRIYATNLVDNTDLIAVFDMLLQVAKNANKEDIPETIAIISDMEIDQGCSDWRTAYDKDQAVTDMEIVRRKWAEAGLKMPRLVYWNVAARNDTILDLGPDVSLVSGASAITFEMVMTGKTGKDLMYDKLLSERYENIE